MKNTETRTEKLKEITDKLEKGIMALFNSERYAEYLRVVSKFHNYSLNNSVLIAMQNPDASLVAGFSTWKTKFGRNVKKGEKGIRIIAPAPFKKKKEVKKIDPLTLETVIEEMEVTVPSYRVVSVFDVSQTEGKEIPSISVEELTGNVDNYEKFFAALKKTAPVPIAFEDIPNGSHGYFSSLDQRIAVQTGMSELQTLKEIAHAKMHNIEKDVKGEKTKLPDRQTKEVQAESVAYTVCQHYGLETEEYSFGYIVGWSQNKDMKELKSSLEVIRSTAAEIINDVDKNSQEG